MQDKDSFCINCGAPLKNLHGKYCNAKCQQQYETDLWIERWLSGDMIWPIDDPRPRTIPDRIRNYMFEESNYRCIKCGWSEINEYTGTIPLEIDHIDGNHNNNERYNLRVLCPNCHALTRTYRGANRKNKEDSEDE